MKNSRILLSFILIIAAFSLYSCGADEPVDGFVENSEPTTPGGGGDGGTTAGVFKVDFNGSTWTALTTQAEVTGSDIKILAVKPNGETFGIIVNATSTGTYPANQNILGYSPNALTDGYLAINENNPLENTGSVTITSINTANKTISGTFNFKGYWTDDTKPPVQFTNGSFTNLPYTAETTTSPNTDIFDLKLDGTDFIENDINVAEVGASGVPDYYSIVGVKTNGDTVGISIAKSLGVGTYQFAGAFGPQINASSLIGGTIYIGDTGSITIVSKTATRIAGTFNVVVKNMMTNQTKTITAGTFNVELP